MFDKAQKDAKMSQYGQLKLGPDVFNYVLWSPLKRCIQQLYYKVTFCGLSACVKLLFQ